MACLCLPSPQWPCVQLLSCLHLAGIGVCHSNFFQHPLWSNSPFSARGACPAECPASILRHPPMVLPEQFRCSSELICSLLQTPSLLFTRRYQACQDHPRHWSPGSQLTPCPAGKIPLGLPGPGQRCLREASRTLDALEVEPVLPGDGCWQPAPW